MKKRNNEDVGFWQKWFVYENHPDRAEAVRDFFGTSEEVNQIIDEIKEMVEVFLDDSLYGDFNV